MDRQTTNFVFLIETGFTMQAFSSAVEVLRLARKFGDASRLDYSVVTLDNGPVAASNGLKVLPNRDIEDIPPNAIIVSVAGAGIETQHDPVLVGKLRRWAREGHATWGMSSGVVRLAQAGLVDGCRVSAHWEDVPYLKENHPEVELSASLFVLASPHSTCAGGGASADLMLNYIAREVSESLVDEIASRLMIDGVRDGRMKQHLPTELRYTTANTTIFAAVRLMEANLFEALPVHEVARRVGVSQRQLERLFKAEFEKSPKGVYQEMRLSEARQEVLAGRRKIIDIALDYGFESAAFSKVYRRAFGVLPSKDRERQVIPMSRSS
ncbi:GlxA family transcriptional regulator [Mameliella alba]|nr:GlxA family transcriptional regulator [Mameliella alba]MBY6168596.1 GlxA family transcriptional regulator [Mameliella alba]MBY6174183.1 GlxA family transcriptional regulator [Mameliella alba]